MLKKNPILFLISVHQNLSFTINFFFQTGERGRKRQRSPFSVSISSSEGHDLPDPGSLLKRKRKIAHKSLSCHLCPAKVRNLTQHIRQVHKKQPARLATNHQGYIIRECSITCCGRFYPRKMQHLRKFHKMVDNNVTKEWAKKAKLLVMSPERYLH